MESILQKNPSTSDKEEPMASELVIQVLVLLVLITLWAQAVVQIRLMNERQKGRQDVFSGLGSLLHGNTPESAPPAK